MDKLSLLHYVCLTGLTVTKTWEEVDGKNTLLKTTCLGKEIILPSTKKILNPTIKCQPIREVKQQQQPPPPTSKNCKNELFLNTQPMVFSDIWNHIMYILADDCNFTLVLAFNQGRCIDRCVIIMTIIYQKTVLITLVKVFNNNRRVKHLHANIIIHNFEYNKQICICNLDLFV